MFSLMRLAMRLGRMARRARATKSLIAKKLGMSRLYTLGDERVATVRLVGERRRRVCEEGGRDPGGELACIKLISSSVDITT